MKNKTIMIDMDEVIVKGRFSDFLNEFLGGVDFEKLNSYYRQDLIKGKEEDFKKNINIEIYIKMIMKLLLNHYLIV